MSRRTPWQSVSSPRASSRSRALSASTASSPDGVAITSGLTGSIQVKQSGSPWQTVGSAALTAAPTAVPYKIPRSLNGEKLSVRALASGAGYATKGSATQKVRVGQSQKVKLSAAHRDVPRLHKAKLSGRAIGFPAHSKVTLFQRQANGGGWSIEGTTRTGNLSSFYYSEVVHVGDRYYRACIRSTCSKAVFVHVTG